MCVCVCADVDVDVVDADADVDVDALYRRKRLMFSTSNIGGYSCACM